MPKRLEIDKSEAVEGETVKKVWDIKKILIGLVVLALLFIVGAYLFLPAEEEVNSPSRETLGISASSNEPEDVPPLPSKEDIQSIILNAQDALSEITADNLTSSQAAIQKVITDLEALQGKKDAGDIFCDLVCKEK